MTVSSSVSAKRWRVQPRTRSVNVLFCWSFLAKPSMAIIGPGLSRASMTLYTLIQKDVDGRIASGQIDKRKPRRDESVSEKVLAAVRTGPSKTEIREYPMPDVPADAALMKMEVGGICGTDVKLYKHPPYDKRR